MPATKKNPVKYNARASRGNASGMHVKEPQAPYIVEIKKHLAEQSRELKEIKTILRNQGLGPAPEKTPAAATVVKVSSKEKKHFEEMKLKVMRLFKESPRLDYLDVIEKLKLKTKDVDTVVRIFDELTRDGVIHAITTE